MAKQLGCREIIATSAFTWLPNRPTTHLPGYGLPSRSYGGPTYSVGWSGRNSNVVEQLITQEYGLEEAPAALDFAMRNPAAVMKVVVRPNG